MIKLQGSEKQVAWATEIRNNNIKALEREIEGFKNREGDFEEIIEKLEKALVDISNGKPEAKFWIENQGVAKAFVQRCKK